MKTKQILRCLLGLVFVAAILQSCGGEDTIQVGLLMGDSSQERWQQDQTEFVNKVQELGGQAIVRSASNDPARQLEQAKELLEEGVDVLVVVPVDGSAAAAIVEAAHEAEVKVLAYDRIITGAPLDYYISFDNVRVGELQAKYALKHQPTGNYAIISGPESDNNSKLFYEGQRNILEEEIEAGNINLVYTTSVAYWDDEEAYQAMMEAFETVEDTIHVVLAANDDLASGVRNALRETGRLGDVLLTGQDADLDACRAILEGNQAMTVYKPIRALANTAAIAAVSLAQHDMAQGMDREVDNGTVKVPAILLDPIPVDVENMRSNVVADGYHEEGELYGTEGSE